MKPSRGEKMSKEKIWGPKYLMLIILKTIKGAKRSQNRGLSWREKI
jgi:hypothetical protein